MTSSVGPLSSSSRFSMSGEWSLAGGGCFSSELEEWMFRLFKLKSAGTDSLFSLN